MNKNDYLRNQELKNRAILLKIYRKQTKKIQKKLAEALEKGNSTAYLESLRADIKQEVKRLERYFKTYAVTQTEESYVNGAKSIDNQINQLKFATPVQLSTLATFGKVNREAINVLAQATYEPLGKLAQRIGRNTLEFLSRENFENTEKLLKATGKLIGNDTLRKIGIEGVQDAVFGSESWQQSARKIRDELLKEGALKVPYYDKKGNLYRLVDANDYSKMVARTTTANTLREGAKDRIMEVFEDKGDLVEIIGISKFPDSPCIPYQGKILSLEGNTDQSIIDKLGDKYAGLLADAEEAGLFHCNCVHSYGVSETILAAYGELV